MSQQKLSRYKEAPREILGAKQEENLENQLLFDTSLGISCWWTWSIWGFHGEGQGLGALGRGRWSEASIEGGGPGGGLRRSTWEREMEPRLWVWGVGEEDRTQSTLGCTVCSFHGFEVQAHTGCGLGAPDSVRGGPRLWQPQGTAHPRPATYSLINPPGK